VSAGQVGLGECFVPALGEPLQLDDRRAFAPFVYGVS
jgi:hypothetical protein